ncbi:MAG: GNAT family N-acetyltransferase [Cyanobacteria bacterium]|nr:GNAT family N-acetyltransferase [Cyanobacteriota bacterium]MDA0867616.1 GNAT family N-acetyltransferase [Cyanobacteriota bacterium]
MTLQVRPAEKADLPAVLNLYRQPDLDDGEALTLEAAQQLLAKIQTYPSYQLYVAEGAGQIVGTFTLLIMDNLIHGGTPSAVVEAVAVDPQCQGQGIGREMMAWAIAQCRQAHCYKVTLSAHLKRDRAHRFYESLGFTKHGYSFLLEV